MTYFAYSVCVLIRPSQHLGNMRIGDPCRNRVRPADVEGDSIKGHDNKERLPGQRRVCKHLA